MFVGVSVGVFVGVSVGVAETPIVGDGVNVGVTVTVTVWVGVIVGVTVGDAVGDGSTGVIVIQNEQSTALTTISKPQEKSQLIFFLISHPLPSIIFTMTIGAEIKIDGKVK